MEAQPKDRARDSGNQHRGDDASPSRWSACVKHDQSHFHQCQHQETNAKKTGNTKVSVCEEEVPKNTHSLHPSNGNRHTSNANVKQKSVQRLYSTAPKASNKGLDYKKATDLKNDKVVVDLNCREDKTDSVLVQNGVIHCGLIINGYSCKENDCTGYEGGYTMPKKRKARCSNLKNTDNAMRENDMQQGNTTHEPRTFDTEATTKGGTSRLDCLRATHKAETQTAPRRVVAASEPFAGESQRKNSDGKTVGKKAEERHKAKVCSPSKEDSWTLFKPPPVFPVDNSSAKIVPKISYASKVKENLNKVAQGGGEALPPPAILSQVPMSAMKTITSASLTNGPVSANGCPSVGTFFASAASGSGDNVASPLESNCSSTSSPIEGEVYEPRKCSLLIYPLNMQPTLPSARHLNPSAAQTNQKALGEIFQNKWGLSFINDPNLGPEDGSRPVPAEDNASLHQCQAKAGHPCFNEGPFFFEPGTLSQDAAKSTSIILPACSHLCVLAEEENRDKTCVDSAFKDNGATPAQGYTNTVLFGTSKEQALSKDVCRRCSWGSFDIKAAVTYHTEEMEYIFSLQKQYPNRVLVYDETKDGRDQ
ncbi:FMR1-interacting protein NUFIP2 [Syngnathoides biaculeatus]|uniref:FMR1-interacting protein NUFIP2 n=1 Tax=Syngnathoides biaculeatus TaxID=300417 RepID=UPI002ADDC075|nr:FMR1-interacting protein NUFIP2 [Syngnathoides biaculeatus]